MSERTPSERGSGEKSALFTPLLGTAIALGNNYSPSCFFPGFSLAQGVHKQTGQPPLPSSPCFQQLLLAFLWQPMSQLPGPEHQVLKKPPFSLGERIRETQPPKASFLSSPNYPTGLSLEDDLIFPQEARAWVSSLLYSQHLGQGLAHNGHSARVS